MKRNHRDELDRLEPDPTIGEALRSLHPRPPVDEVDWSALRGRIAARAAVELEKRRPAGLRRSPSLFDRVRANLRLWTAPLVPVAVAAGIAVVVWTRGDAPDAAELDDVTAAPTVSVEEVLSADVTEQEFRLIVSGRANPDALLLLALDES